MQLTFRQENFLMLKIKSIILIISCFMPFNYVYGGDGYEKDHNRLILQPKMPLVQASQADTDLRHDVRFFGAIGDGHHDDTQSIKNAIQKTDEGETIFFPSGKYLVTSPIIIEKSSINIMGCNAEIIFRPVKNQKLKFHSLNGENSYQREIPSSVFLIKGNLEIPDYKVSGNYVENAYRLKFTTPVKQLSKNDLVIVASSDHERQDIIRKKKLYLRRDPSFISYIDHVEKDTIVIADSLPFALEAKNNPIVFKIHPVVNVRISDLTITIDPAMPNKENISGVTLIYAAGSIVKNISMRYASKESINLQYCYQCDIKECKLNDMLNHISASDLGVNIDHSHFCLIRSNDIANCRNGVLLNHGNSNCVIENNEIKGTPWASIDLHGEFNCYNIIRANLIYKSKAGIVVGSDKEKHYNDGLFNELIGNKIADCDIGIQINNKTPSTIIGDNWINDGYGENRLMMIRLTGTF